ncbi:MAG: RidA family protein [Stackebrandtia sp.]
MEAIEVPELDRFGNDLNFSRVVRSGNLVLVSGLTGTAPPGHVANDAAQQVRMAFQQVGWCLAAAGLEYRHIVEMTTYHVGLRDHLDVFARVKDEFITAPYPAWTAIGVSELITPGAIVEIRVTAELEGL